MIPTLNSQYSQELEKERQGRYREEDKTGGEEEEGTEWEGGGNRMGIGECVREGKRNGTCIYMTTCTTCRGK